MRFLAWSLLCASALGAGIMLGGWQSLPRPAAQVPRSFGSPATFCSIVNPAVNESSGLAPSYRYPGQWYTHNDSGDQPRFFRFDSSGKVTATVQVDGAQAIDWEDMSSVTLKGKPYLYFGDVGDNASARKSIQVYRVEEPMGDQEKTRPAEKYEIAYPDGPHNSETLMVDPRTGDLWIVTKVNRGASGVYRASAPAHPGKVELQKMGDVTIGTAIPGSQMITGGDISPDGRYVIIRTYTAAHEFKAPLQFADWFRQTPKRVELAVEQQGESIAYRPDGRALLTTSEGSPCPVSSVAISGG